MCLIQNGHFYFHTSILLYIILLTETNVIALICVIALTQIHDTAVSVQIRCATLINKKKKFLRGSSFQSIL